MRYTIDIAIAIADQIFFLHRLKSISIKLQLVGQTCSNANLYYARAIKASVHSYKSGVLGCSVCAYTDAFVEIMAKLLIFHSRILRYSPGRVQLYNGDKLTTISFAIMVGSTRLLAILFCPESGEPIKCISLLSYLLSIIIANILPNVNYHSSSRSSKMLKAPQHSQSILAKSSPEIET